MALPSQPNVDRSMSAHEYDHIVSKSRFWFKQQMFNFRTNVQKVLSATLFTNQILKEMFGKTNINKAIYVDDDGAICSTNV